MKPSIARPTCTSCSTAAAYAAADGWDPVLTYIEVPMPLELGGHPVNDGDKAAHAGAGVVAANDAAGAVEPEVGAAVGSGVMMAPGGSTSPGH